MYDGMKPDEQVIAVDEEANLSRVPVIDRLTGQPLTPEERRWRARVLTESDRGFIAVDRTYHETHVLIHQPLVVDEVGEFVHDSWQLERANSTVLTVKPGQIGDVSRAEHDMAAMQEFGIMVARKAVGEAAARLMRVLYEMANDPPYWRQRRIQVRLTDLMDRMEYRKDTNGYHRSKNRRHLGQTLLALHFTHMSFQRSQRGGSVGAMGPLISGLEFQTREDTSSLTPEDVFKRGLPDVVTVVFNEQWYRIRDSAGRPTDQYALVPRTLRLMLSDGSPVGRRPNPVAALRAYFTDAFGREESGVISITRDVLQTVSGIKDSHPSRSTRMLRQTMERLCAEGVIGRFEPSVLSRDPQAEIRIIATLPGDHAAG
jgi:hypothetical protein